MNEKRYPFWQVMPHVVIIGAGASRAACPKGDEYGRKLPLMSDFIDILDLHPFLRHNVPSVEDKNIEECFDSIFKDDPNSPLLVELEQRINDYFSKLRIPSGITLYDMLLLSLQSKDAIFSFNWDPLLLQAYARNSSVGELPAVHFLHGNVAVGVCLNDKVCGHLWRRCSKCGKPFEPAKLLYPITDKKYSEDEFILEEWKALEEYLNAAFILTIFGYGAPKTDVKAREMMMKAWAGNNRYKVNEIEIIDTKPRRALYRNWSDFAHNDHYVAFETIRNSLSFRYARRSCNAWGDTIMMCEPWQERKMPDFRKLERLQEWVRPLVEEEKAFKEKDIGLARF